MKRFLFTILLLVAFSVNVYADGPQIFGGGTGGSYDDTGIGSDATIGVITGDNLSTISNDIADDTINELFTAINTWAATLDALYEGELNNSAGLASALSDEVGTGFAVFSADSPLTGDPTVTDATPTITLQDSDDAAGTAGIYGESSGGANDIITSIGTEDSSGAKTPYININGVTETIDFLKNTTGSGWIFDETAELTDDNSCAGVKKTVVAGYAASFGDWVYIATADGKAELADSDSTTWEVNKAIGIACSSAAEDADVVVLVYGYFRDDDFTFTVTQGSTDYIYLDTTAGAETQTRPKSASIAVQQLGYAMSDDQIWVEPKDLDFSRTRPGTDADGETLTCLEVQNTAWEVTAAATIIGPALSSCPTQDFTIVSSVAGAVVYDPDATDDTIIDGTAKGDGVAWTSGSALGDSITVWTYDTDTLIGISNGWTAP